jgi:methylenetetrahydrofolate dehydrogenase (NADP+)/methenyltetrahydrofolate cyclohydrolase
MTARVLDGQVASAAIFAEVAAAITTRIERGASVPHLSVVLVGDDPGSHTYVRMKRRNAEQVGITSSDHRLPATATTEEVVALVSSLDSDPAVSGILVQLPLPTGIDAGPVVEAVSPGKDVDGLHPFNAGRLAQGNPTVLPCTPGGIIELLDRNAVPIEGRRAVVIGRSNMVGKPLALLLLGRNATVTMCHSKTEGLAEICREADILVAAAGRLHFVEPSMVKPGAAVIDVGVNRLDGKLAGDVRPDVADVAGWLTPNPGGVGPMTRAMLLLNTLRAEERRRP